MCLRTICYIKLIPHPLSGKLYYSDPDYERIYEVDTTGENPKVLRNNVRGAGPLKSYYDRHTSGIVTIHGH